MSHITKEANVYRLNIAEYPVASLVRIVADLLNSIIKTNDALINNTVNNTVTHFHSRAVPNITVNAYLTRILRFAPFSNEALLSLLIYFDRIAKLKKAKYAVNSLTVHRLLITSIVVASKFTSDVFYPNTRYAKVGGIPLGELNQLELEFLFLCNFDLHVKLEDMQAYGDQLLTHALTMQRCRLPPEIKITSSVTTITSPLLSPPTSITSSHFSSSSSLPPSPPLHYSNSRKRTREREEESETKATKRDVSVDVVTNAPTSLFYNKLCTYSHHRHLDTILSTYTHDC
ncbi:PHO85 cyclin-7 [Choanephora cucurbitarum]|uniref:PHO85 cyclin-7 n=1 Tax=Choanephora cucurbitarum TaxID=101091 RepID=A0A1C7NA63_9FUNG|nr:PHO85 cyclin-7 [Choanephora cucurbitarum]